MLYLVDANILINAKNNTHPFDTDSAFWQKFQSSSSFGFVKIPYQICLEISAGNDELSHWIMQNMATICLDEEMSEDLMKKVINVGYELGDAPEKIITRIEPDASLIVHALVDKENRAVVTNEKRTNNMPRNRSISDVCNVFGIPVYNHEEFDDILDSLTKHMLLE